MHDVDGTDESVLAGIQIGGRLRKVMIQANKNGFLYVLDRTDCSLIAANPYVKVNWATHIDLNGPACVDRYLQPTESATSSCASSSGAPFTDSYS